MLVLGIQYNDLIHECDIKCYYNKWASITAHSCKLFFNPILFNKYYLRLYPGDQTPFKWFWMKEARTWGRPLEHGREIRLGLAREQECWGPSACSFPVSNVISLNVLLFLILCTKELHKMERQAVFNKYLLYTRHDARIFSHSSSCNLLKDSF